MSAYDFVVINRAAKFKPISSEPYKKRYNKDDNSGNAYEQIQSYKAP